MHYFILTSFAIFFALGLYLILAHLLAVPTLKTTRAVMGVGKREKKQTKSADAMLHDVAIKLSTAIPMDDYRRRKLAGTLQSAEINMTPEVYLHRALSLIHNRRCRPSTL